MALAEELLLDDVLFEPGVSMAASPATPPALVVDHQGPLVAWTASAGNSAELKKAQNQATKNITSEAMNRIMP